MLKDHLQIAGVLVALIISIGGVFFGVDSTYLRRTYAEERFAAQDYNYYSMRLNMVDESILRLEREKNARPRQWTANEEALLRRLYTERQVLLCKLRIRC